MFGLGGGRIRGVEVGVWVKLCCCFLQVEAEEVEKVTLHYEIESVPSFVLLKVSEICFQRIKYYFLIVFCQKLMSIQTNKC